MNYTRFIKFWHILQGKNITRKIILDFILFYFKVLTKSNEFSCTYITYNFCACILHCFASTYEKCY